MGAEAFFGLILLAIFIGSIAGLVGIFRLRDLQIRVTKTEQELKLLSTKMDSKPLHVTDSQMQQASEDQIKQPTSEKSRQSSTPFVAQVVAQVVVQELDEEEHVTQGHPTHLSKLWVNMQHNWMIWLGGMCVALAGIFLAKYSLEYGLLGPLARVSLGIVTGLALFTTAEWLRIRTGESHPAFAALAGGGSITLFAVFLAALNLYEMISPTTTFILLAIVALTTMGLSFLHGPVLAAIGILGAYIVPLLISSDNGNLVFVMAYSLIISASALLLLRYVYRNWLWWGTLTGALAWWLISLQYPETEGLRGWYLTLLAYLMLTIPTFDWRLSRLTQFSDEKYPLLIQTKQNFTPASENQLALGILLILLAYGVSIFHENQVHTAIIMWSPLGILVLLAARYREQLTLAPWLLLIIQICAFVASRIGFENERIFLTTIGANEEKDILVFFISTAAIFSVLSLRNLAICRFKGIWSSLAVLAPLLLLAAGYFLTSRTMVSWQWSALLAFVALIYLGIASGARARANPESLIVWLIFGGHFAAALSASMVIDQAGLTLVFAVQIISISIIIRRFKLVGIDWLLKLLVAIVVCRLTLNPWLGDYPTDVHWSLWTFGGATICCLASMKILSDLPFLRKWTEAAALHLFVLTIWAETRYQLYDGIVFIQEYSLKEAGIYIALFGSIALVYYVRGQVSQHLQKFYFVFSQLLMVFALTNYGVIVLATLISSPWLWAHIGETPIVNMLLLIYAVPVALGTLSFHYYMPRYRKMAMLFSALSGFIFISLEIRHLWQASIRLQSPTSNGELYTYSVVWLLMAIITILGGTWRYGENCYKAGMVLLGLVIAKLFFIDMSDLEGLLRVASFMGLGVSLLGISYLHQKLNLADR